MICVFCAIERGDLNGVVVSRSHVHRLSFRGWQTHGHPHLSIALRNKPGRLRLFGGGNDASSMNQSMMGSLLARSFNLS